MSVLPLIAPGVFTVAGLSLTASQVRLLTRARATRSWQCCSGEIVGAAPGGYLEAGTRGDVWAGSFARIRYRYSANGQPYEGTQISLSGPPPESWTSSSGYAAVLLQRYAVGTKVAVWYDPKDPQQAVLEPGDNRSNYWGVAAGVGFFLVGLLWFLGAVAA